ncbi:GIY-YIG nuclease family protein [Lysinibacillus sp. NPDC094403]|uniref:GIY-YIG nuclease family protein n=1 Tax=Lysinibacillus sp. NPDC094403 TaxID=3390581 RepID=UPI003D0645CF
MAKQKVKYKWYSQWWFIILMLVLAYATAFITLGFAIAGFILRSNERKRVEGDLKFAEIHVLDQLIDSQKVKLTEMEAQIEEKDNFLIKLEREYKEEIRLEYQSQASQVIENANTQASQIIKEAADKSAQTLIDLQKYIEEKDLLNEEQTTLLKNVKTNENKLLKLKTEFIGIRNLINTFPDAINMNLLESEVTALVNHFDENSMLYNLVELNCHYKNSKELRKEMNRNKKELNKLLEAYVDRYTTKANRSIYQLMVIGLQAELQNILYTLSYDKLESAQETVKELIRKYLAICADGNQSILPTITRFLTEIEPIFLEAIEVEYHYYIKREQEKEEQRIIREQMRQDAAERKELEAQKKKLEQEEAKYLVEMNRNRELLLTETDSEKISALEARILELEAQQLKVTEEKEEILKRANGKAGYVYVISNLGSFGDRIFKIGMTRRMNPMDRVDELGDASVPFRFDVHAMIFSDNAVDLESKLHEELNIQRVNKVNLRKEFFETNINDLQTLVETIDPTVEFRTTLVAQEFHRSLEIKKEQLSEQIA